VLWLKIKRLKSVQPQSASVSATKSKMPTKAQCWVVSYARRRGNEGRAGGGGVSREGLLAIPMQSNVMLLHSHPDGARLAHGEYVAGLSPGRKINIGDYECELLMLAPHGGGGNPAYAAAFVTPGEVLPSMKPHNKDEGWLSWLGLDEDYDEEPVVLRAPQLPHPNDPQPSAPIAFGYSGFTAAYQNASCHAPTVPHQQPAYSSYQSPRMAQDAYESERVATKATSRAPAQPVSRRAIEPAVAEPLRQRERKTSVFEEEFLEEEAFDREVRFEQANANERMMSSEPAAVTTTLAGTQDEMESLRRQLAELEKLTGVRADDAENALKEDILKAQELIAELPEVSPPLKLTEEQSVETVVETTHEVPSREAPAPASAVAQPEAPPSTPRHVSDVEIPQTLSASSNIFKVNDGGGVTTSQPRPRVAPAPAPRPREPERVQASPVSIRPAATSPVVRSTSQRASQTASMPVPSVANVTAEEVHGNAAWAAAVARRNRSVDEDSDASDDDFDSDGDNGPVKSRASAPARVVENIASQPNRVKKADFVVDREKQKEPVPAARENERPAPELTSVASKLAAFEDASRTPPSKSSRGVASPKAENGEEYVKGSVAARASMFGEQASFRRGGRA